MFFNPFKFYDEMLDIYTNKSQDEEEPEQEEKWVTCEYDVPEHLSEELDQLVAEFLKDNGYED